MTRGFLPGGSKLWAIDEVQPGRPAPQNHHECGQFVSGPTHAQTRFFCSLPPLLSHASLSENTCIRGSQLTVEKRWTTR